MCRTAPAPAADAGRHPRAAGAGDRHRSGTRRPGRRRTGTLGFAGELDARSALANAAQADLFVSIHHNAARNRRVNDLLVFYKMNDPQQSRDIARLLAPALQEALAAPSARSLPGNYRVLRTCRMPAVLGEASFMTHRRNARHLETQRRLQAEARGYLRGIARYFARGTPRVIAAEPDNRTLAETRPQIRIQADPGLAGAAIDPASIRCSLDGAPLSARLSSTGTITARPPAPLANAPHRVCVSLRSTTGNSSPRHCFNYQVSLPPAGLSLTPTFTTLPADGSSRCPVTIRVTDRLRRPVADGTRVRVRIQGATPVTATRTTRHGQCRVLVLAPDTAGDIVVQASAGTAAGSVRLRCGVPTQTLYTVTLRDERGAPITGMPIRHAGATIATSDEDGFAYWASDCATAADIDLAQAGYAPLRVVLPAAPGTMQISNQQLRRIDGGIFFGTTIGLDPGDECARQVLTRLQERIRAAGGRAFMTWAADGTPEIHHRIRTANQQQAQLLLHLTCRRGRARITHYHRSSAGQRLARQLATALQLKKIRVRDDADPLLIHTAMPAVCIRVPKCGTPTYADDLYAGLRVFLGYSEKVQAAGQTVDHGAH